MNLDRAQIIFITLACLLGLSCIALHYLAKTNGNAWCIEHMGIACDISVERN